MHPKFLSIADYNYSLPEEKIARYPLEQRDQSKLLCYRKGAISSDTYGRLAAHLPAGSRLLLNNTRVLEARILFTKNTGAVIEIFCLEPDDRYHDITEGLGQTGSVYWKCMIGGASKWKPGQALQKELPGSRDTLQLQARYLEKKADHFIIGFEWSPSDKSFAEVLQLAGQIPLPPYFRRAPEDSDRERYQTLYARPRGSVAAPTAGLHFTPALFESLEQKKIRSSFLTLHVGAGTFKPVKSARLEGHPMHGEAFEISRRTLEELAADAERLYAVGTTSLRCVESLYWMGMKLLAQPDLDAPALDTGQWDPYESPTDPGWSPAECLNLLKAWMDRKGLDTLAGRTRILIAPGYRVRMVKGLITNFHQPQSTLLLLVAALVGEDWKKIYGYALENDFRFLSYGDGCLIEP